MLDSTDGAVQEPIRSEIFGSERFAQHGRSLADTHRAAKARLGQVTFYPRLLGNIRTLRTAHDYMAEQADSGHDLSPAAEWLVDNFALIEGQLHEIREGLPLSYYRELPVLQDEPLVGLPRIYGVAWALVAHTDGAFDETLVTHFLQAYQERRELSQGELWALPTTLRAVLVENLRRLADRMAAQKAAREVANLCADRIDTLHLGSVQAMLAAMERRGVGQVFMVQLAQNLMGRRAASTLTPLAQIRQWLQDTLPDLMPLQAQHNADQTADNLSVGNAVTSLRQIGAADWTGMVASTSLTMQVMLDSPVFRAEDAASRDTTLHAIERLSARSGQSESTVARQLLTRMHTGQGPAALAGHWLTGPGRQTLEADLNLGGQLARTWRKLGHWSLLPTYLLTLLAGTAALVLGLLASHSAGWQAGAGEAAPLLGGVWGQALTVLASLALWIPASEAVVVVLNRLISESVRPSRLPRFALEQGIPPEERVLVVIPAMLNHATTVAQLAHRLHQHYLANQEPHAQFALLTDWPDADQPSLPGDAALLQAARDALAQLNQRHPAAPGAPNRFILLHRTRSHSATQQCWIGWERKRGKLEQLLAALATGTPGPFLDLGADSQLAPHTRHLLTLDADTQLPPGRLRALVGVAAHPQNQPRLDATGRRVVAGYGILQPRLVPPLPLAVESTPYHWLFSGQSGIDPYSAMTSDVYQDVFGEGSFTGKGLLNVAALHAVMGDRLPSEQVLSHDLLEGALARCGVVSDVTLIESEPHQPAVANARLHRWTRGDWQLLPFVLQPHRWPMATISRWKLLDNLRRSLVAPALVVLLLLSMLGVGLTPLATLALALVALAAGPLMGAAAGLLPARGGFAWRRYYRGALLDVGRALATGLWHLAHLLPQASRNTDAIGRSVYRLTISRRLLLEWTPAAALHTTTRPRLAVVCSRHAPGPLLAAGLLAALLALGHTPAWPSVAVLGLWMLAPALTWVAVHLRLHTVRPPLTPDQTTHLLHVARDTWRLFERVVDAENHHLPPDNLQTSPVDMLATRTSPTNIGLYLLSVGCARQFGWLGTEELLERLEATLATLDKLQRHEGHFLNWYDTLSLQPLLPRYVSTVDSGNLGTHLLTVAQACTALASDPYDPAPGQRAVLVARQRLSQPGRSAPNPDLATDPHLWWQADLLATRTSARRDELAAASGDAPLATRRLHALAQRLETLAWAANYTFLYHPKRQLFHIGYRIEDRVLDTAFYDLLASESRMTSLLAIAKGDVPVAHWAALGRPFFAVGSLAGLRSWSGSMFEYLMPSLVLIEPQGSALREAGQAALLEQVDYLQRLGLPWGMSESAYAGRDQSLTYQYAPQGVPRLALRRTPAAELVVAPYATALAAQVDAPLACANLRALEALSAHGHYGFCEALDFTPSRQTHGGTCMRVHTHMAHHQGMTIVALANVLLNHQAQHWGMANPHLEAVQSLMHERAPRHLAVLHAPPARLPAQALLRRSTGLAQTHTPGTQAIEPTQLLSNGRYSVALRPNGAGWSRWGQTGLSRWRDDALRDDCGSFIYLQLEPGQSPVSATQHPAPDPNATYQSTFQMDRVVFSAQWPGLSVQTTVWVSPEDDIELRRVVISNLGEHTLELDVLSAFEVTLATQAADQAHPAFSNLFVQAQWLAHQQALVFERTPRLTTERHVQAAHFVAETRGEVRQLRCQTDRQHWLGRNHATSGPLATLVDAPPQSGPLSTGLDPVAVLSVGLRVPAGGQCMVTFAVAAADDSATLHAVVDKYRQPSSVERASLMSATLAGIQSRPHHLGPDFPPALHALTTALVCTLAHMPASGPGQATRPGAPVPVCDRRLLWPLALSGERPLLLVSVGAVHGLGLLRSVMQALHEWARCALPCDVVVLSTEPASYLMPLQRELASLREQHQADLRSFPAGNVAALHLHRAADLSPGQLGTLDSLARVRLVADGRPLHHHVRAWADLHNAARQRAASAPRAWLNSLPTHPVAHRHGAAPPAPTGQFQEPSGNFSFEVGATQRPTRPWANVLANPGFGTLVTEAGGGNTWALNSRLNQLTSWSNDPVADPPAEWFWLQDRRSQAVWSLSPSAWGDASLSYHVSHGQGHTTISHRRGALAVSVVWCVDADTAIKQVRVSLTNHGPSRQHLRLVGMAEWQMGEQRGHRATTLTACQVSHLGHTQTTTLLCTQAEQAGGFGQGTAFLAMPVLNAAVPSDPDGPDWTCDRRELFDAEGKPVLPQRLGQHSGWGLDPCAALARRLTLLPGQRLEQVFVLGYADSPAAATELAQQATQVHPAERERAVQASWRNLLGTCQVSTPDPLLDAMVNHWLLYQTVSSRLWAKAGFYQAGGATGYRDQLQDAMALSWAAPDVLRAQIVLAASRQFEAGDVQHWWHSPGGAGVRTHFSDDLLWLPFACAHHQRSTGDASLLDETVPFLEGPDIPEGAEDSYHTPRTSATSATVYEHAARALDRSLATGHHGLPLMGTGDWNDGMNRVGHEGQGESVWLAWFLCAMTPQWIDLARSRHDEARAQRWQNALAGWQAALAGPAWDGEWYQRAFFDDGSPLGSHTNTEAQIDLLAQAWSVLSGAAPLARQQQAMAGVETHLVDADAGLIQLLTPPLAHASPSAGYIQAYPPGVRENGGQYAHAGVWALMAAARLARDTPADSPARNTPYRYFSYLSPAHRAAHPTRAAAYGLEPYAVAGDVYSQPPWTGRGGWSWYTGAAGWLHRAAIESLFGLDQQAHTLCLRPCLPTGWNRADLTLVRQGKQMHFTLLRTTAQNALPMLGHAAHLLLPGQPVAWDRLGADSTFVVPLLATEPVPDRTPAA